MSSTKRDFKGVREHPYIITNNQILGGEPIIKKLINPLTHATQCF